MNNEFRRIFEYINVLLREKGPQAVERMMAEGLAMRDEDGVYRGTVRLQEEVQEKLSTRPEALRLLLTAYASFPGPPAPIVAFLHEVAARFLPELENAPDYLPAPPGWPHVLMARMGHDPEALALVVTNLLAMSDAAEKAAEMGRFVAELLPKYETILVFQV